MSSMRKLGIASTAWSKGIRVFYTRSENGTCYIHEACLDQDATILSYDEEARDGWYNAPNLPVTCAPGSALSCISWGDPNSKNMSLFYQAEDSSIHEARFDGKTWSASSFTQDAMPGTALTTIYDENADRAILFFQDTNHSVCSRTATKGAWGNVVCVDEARAGTPIAAAFDGTGSIWSFSQKKNLDVGKYYSYYSDCSSWQPTGVITFFDNCSSMAAFSCGQYDYRVYLQLPSTTWVVNQRNDKWPSAIIPTPDTDISAFIRVTSKGNWIHVYSANSEKHAVVQQRVFPLELYSVPETLVSDVSLPDPDSQSTQVPVSQPPALTRPFPAPHKIAITAAVWVNGMNSIYYSGNGHIRDASRNLNAPAETWCRGVLDGTCAPGSSLCCIPWGDSNVSLFYQTADSIIRQMKYDGQGWSVSSFTGTDAMPGTALAVVHNRNADRAMLFYQSNTNYICVRTAMNWVWSPPVPIYKIRSAALIAATTWSETNDVHLFLQDGDLIRHFSGSFDGNWVEEPITIRPEVGADVVGMFAVSWSGPNIRLYIHKKDNSLKEASCTPGTSGYVLNMLNGEMLPNTDVSACIWNSSIRISCVDFTEALQQRVLDTATNATNQWQTETVLVDITDALPPALSIPDLTGTDLEDYSASNRQFYNPTPTLRPMAIAATGGINNVRVYTQSGDGFIREGAYDEHGSPWDPDYERRQIKGWQLATLPKPCAPWSSLCCLSWDGLGSTQNMSVFFQTRENFLREMRFDGRVWVETDFVQPDAMPGTAMAEVHNANGSVLFVFQDAFGFLSYRLRTRSTWGPAARICQAAFATPVAATTWSKAKDIRLYFQDKANQVREFSITFRNEYFYDGDWTLGSLKIPGLLTGSMAAISWPGPEIRVYMQATDKYLRELSCGPDLIYKLPPTMLNAEAAPNGPMAAFASRRLGCSHLFWAGSDRLVQQRILFDSQWQAADTIGDMSTYGPIGVALVGPFTLNQLVDQANAISQNIIELGEQNTALSQSVQEMTDSLSFGLRPSAQLAVAGILVLAHSVEDLSKASGDAIDQLVAKCQAQSIDIGYGFDDLYAKAHTLLANVTNLATDITYQQSTIELRRARVQAILQISTVMREGEEKVLLFQKGQAEGAQKHIEMLEKARQDAQNAKAEAEKLRIVRDVFTLGLGEAGDWGNLKDAINHLDTLVLDANNEIAASQTAKEKAQTAVDALNAELARHTKLESDLDGFGPILQALLNALSAFIAAADLEKAALDVGVALSALVGKASTLRVEHTARELVTSILAIESQIGTSTKLSSVFVTKLDSLDDAFRAIGNTPVGPSEGDSLV